MEQIANKKTNVGVFLLGILFLSIGVLLLISRAGVIDLNFGRIIAFLVFVVGGFEAITAFASSNHGRLFWGASLFLGGLLILLVSYDFIPGSWDQIWPSALIIPGLSFLMLYFSNPKEYLLLVITVLFSAVGWVGMLIANGNFNFSDHMLVSLHFLLPIAVVLAGFYLIRKNSFRAKP